MADIPSFCSDMDLESCSTLSILLSSLGSKLEETM